MKKLPLTSSEQVVIEKLNKGYGGMVRFMTNTKDRATCTRLTRKGYLVLVKYPEDKDFDCWQLPPKKDERKILPVEKKKIVRKKKVSSCKRPVNRDRYDF